MKDSITAPAAPRTYTLVTLAEAAGVSVRTARHYLTEDVVPRPKSRGRATAYTDEHLWRLRAARVLRGAGTKLAEIRERLAKMPFEEVRALVEPPTRPSPEVAAVMGDVPMERWERATLMPGIELMVRADAGPFAARIAREIVANYRVT